MESVDHHLGGVIRRQGRQQRSPQLPPGLTREKVVLQLGSQQSSGLTAQALDHMTEVDAPPWPALASAPVQPRQGFEVVAAQEQIQPVVVQVHRELLADQP